MLVFQYTSFYATKSGLGGLMDVPSTDERLRVELATARLLAQHWHERAEMWKREYEKLAMEKALSVGGKTDDPLHTEN